MDSTVLIILVIVIVIILLILLVAASRSTGHKKSRGKYHGKSRSYGHGKHSRSKHHGKPCGCKDTCSCTPEPEPTHCPCPHKGGTTIQMESFDPVVVGTNIIDWTDYNTAYDELNAATGTGATPLIIKEDGRYHICIHMSSNAGSPPVTESAIMYLKVNGGYTYIRQSGTLEVGSTVDSFSACGYLDLVVGDNLGIEYRSINGGSTANFTMSIQLI